MTLRIFLVEDNKTIRDSLIPALEDLASAKAVGFAESEDAAVKWLTEHSDAWHVAVIDLFLKKGSGLGVLRRCLQRQPHQRTVVLSNYATEDMRSRCRALGADAVFDKSNELEDFMDWCNGLRWRGATPAA